MLEKTQETRKEIRVDVTNGAKSLIEMSEPYIVEIELTGASDLLFHRWNCEAVDEKTRAAKGSKAKKTDDPETFIYRNEKRELCIPGEYVRQAIIHAAKFKQDPRSPRKSAMDLFKAGIASLTPLASLGVKDWDYLDRRRVTIQRNSINRERPAIREGWKATFRFLINLPEYISPLLLQDTLASAGRLVGLADFRPTYGRFYMNRFDIKIE